MARLTWNSIALAALAACMGCSETNVVEQRAALVAAGAKLSLEVSLGMVEPPAQSIANTADEPGQFAEPRLTVPLLDGSPPPQSDTPTDLEIALRESQTGRFMIGVDEKRNEGVRGVYIDPAKCIWR